MIITPIKFNGRPREWYNAYRIEINGESMRKERGKVSSER